MTFRAAASALRTLTWPQCLALALAAAANGAAVVGVHFHSSYRDGFDLVDAIRAHGVEFAVPMWVEEVAPGGVAAPDPRGANAAHGARIVEQLVAAGASICAQLRDHAP